MLVRENGKLYEIDEETGLVTLASTEEAGLEEPEDYVVPESVVKHDRVSVGDRQGNVVAVTDTVYGDSIAVRFDDGTMEELPVGVVKKASSETPEVPTDVESIQAEFLAYTDLPTFTVAEIEAKEARAKQLKAAASKAITQVEAVADQATLDQIVFATTTDLLDLKEAKMNASVDTAAYLDRQPRYRMADNFSAPAPNMGMKGEDSSWLQLEDGEGFSETTDADMAARAVEMVAHFNRDELTDDDFFTQAVSYQVEYLGLEDQGKQAKFAGLAQRARQEKLAEKPVEKKEAAVEDNLDDFDATALFV